ncbi:autotransporter outer membrane beta-barrel domain-containing protein [Rhizobium cauense]|uniref:autotransporter family protein n=1 Tax=Rhizobium cauense TaxID=1166683 RepID=UPI001C6F018B|nr:autotransporter outer membrane beta-barrel domain-containing protein [Rhizobium cauense]MBW9114817.1 autotransporter outer membrane beta-barrel domain-containing protein [Rhizobium cauense]
MKRWNGGKEYRSPRNISFSPHKRPLPFMVGTLSLFVAASAFADCDPAVPASGQTVICNGNPAGYSSTASLGTLTVDVVTGTNFNGPLTLSNIGSLGLTSAGNLQSVTLDNNGIINFVNSGNINNGVAISGAGTYSVTNNTAINSVFSFTGNSTNTIINSGTLNPGITVNGDGSTTILNNVGAFINNGVFINGASQTRIDNHGVIQSNTLLGTGNDTIVNYDPGNINGTVDQGAGNDLFQMLGGRVSATVNQSAGTDRFELSGGEVTGNLSAGADNDSMLWTGGLIGGIDMGDANDVAVFQGLTDTQLKTIQINGGQGNDTLTWQNIDGSNPNRIINWELFSLEQGSSLKMNNNLVLGDSATGTGTLSIDATSVLDGSGFQSRISPAAGGLVTVTNAGVIDLSTGSNSASDSLTIVGNYVGNSGQLWLQSVLGNDSSQADKLVIDSGTTSGSTGIVETNVGGAGDETDRGILVVEAINGATTANGSFFLSRRVSAGVYEYLLYKGSSVPGTANNWYLRNEQDQPGGGDGGDSGDGGDGGDGGGGDDGDDFDGDGGDPGSFDPGPTIRPEVPIMTVVPAVTRGLLRTTLGTFHERHGEQDWMAGEDAGSAVWTRIFGESYDQDLTRLLDEKYDGQAFGFEIGAPFYEHEGEGVLDTFGVFAGYSRAWGDVTADALNRNSIHVGDLSIDAYSLAAYWTRTWDNGSYIDGVLMYSWLDADTNSIGAYNSSFNGNAVTASLEAGTTFKATEHWSIEPQGQIIWQYQNFDEAHDPGGSINYDNNDAFTGRVGVRLQSNYDYEGKPVSPFLLTNVWHEFETTDVVTFNTFPVDATRKATMLELGGGVTADLTENVRVYANASYYLNLGGEDFNAVSGRVGLRITW